MRYISTKGVAPKVKFSEAALNGLAPDGGLYMPETWPKLPGRLLRNLNQFSLPQIGYEISRLFIDELAEETLREITGDAFSFDAPLVPVADNIHILELFHGPTLAFKDFGARFMSRVFSNLRESKNKDLIILAATSGDTGSAVAQGFLGVEGIKVCLLYPGGKVSHIQEQQLTTAGQNVTALEVDGTFDDCQRMVKEAFSDPYLNGKLMLSSANSINIARLIPQTFYYLYGLGQLDMDASPIYCVPSGNFGNLTAGLMARKMGMPATGFIAATNINDVVPEYLETGTFNPRASRRTISNAMDVGNPSNFDRILHLFNQDRNKIKQHIWGASFSDAETKQSIKQLYESGNYLMDPHTAVGYRAVEKYRENAEGYFGDGGNGPFVILATAHPAKFRDVIEPVIGEEVLMPERLRDCLNKTKQSISMPNTYEDLKDWLLGYYQ